MRARVLNLSVHERTMRAGVDRSRAIRLSPGRSFVRISVASLDHPRRTYNRRCPFMTSQNKPQQNFDRHEQRALILTLLICVHAAPAPVERCREWLSAEEGKRA